MANPPSTTDAPKDIFDRNRRRMARDRAVRMGGDTGAGHGFLHNHMAEEIIERLQWVKRDFKDALIIGDGAELISKHLRNSGLNITYADASAEKTEQFDGVQCDEDRLPFQEGQFDLIISNGVLDSVNDLPGALIQMRRILRGDGLMLGAFIGAGSLPRLKAAMAAGDGSRAAPHIHPQIDVRAAGDLLSRTGFAMPVADGEQLAVRYSGLPPLVRDLRGMGTTNVLASSAPYIGKSGLMTAATHFAEAADEDGKTSEIFELVYLSGWAPDASQPKPARRGSGKASLAAALKKK